MRCPLLTILMVSLAAASTGAAELRHADGRRETVSELRRDSKGDFTYDNEGRRVGVVPGEVVVVIDDEGNETVTIPDLATTPDPPETAALLASIGDPKNASWMMAAEQLAKRPTQTKIDALLELAKSPQKATRLQAIGALARLRTRESVVAATHAVLAEKDAKTRGEAASLLFSVQELFKRCDAKDSVAGALTDKNADVRFVFAMLAPPDLEDAKKILRSGDGLKNSDHHNRESAALELGKRGDPAGESILIAMLARPKLPGVDDPQLGEKLLIDEHIAVCQVLGTFGTKPAQAALEKAKKSPHEAVRVAAEKALAAKT
jgi:hypothetical protein